MMVKMGSSLFYIFFDARYGFFRHVTDTNVPNDTSVQCFNIDRNRKKHSEYEGLKLLLTTLVHALEPRH
jgi:hypothetical protein